MNDLLNPLIKKGMTAQLATRRARIAAGEKPLGWKVGLGSPTTLQKLGLQAPLIGFLMQRALLVLRQHGIAQGLHQAGDGAGDWSAHGARSARRGYGESSRRGN